MFRDVCVVLQSKKDSSTVLWTGISVQGIILAEMAGDERLVTHRHPWYYTQKISFKRRRFSITPKTEAGQLHLTKFNYFTDSYRKYESCLYHATQLYFLYYIVQCMCLMNKINCKSCWYYSASRGRYLLQLSTAHHRFQMMSRMQGEPNLADMIEEGEINLSSQLNLPGDKQEECTSISKRKIQYNIKWKVQCLHSLFDISLFRLNSFILDSTHQRCCDCFKLIWF